MTQMTFFPIGPLLTRQVSKEREMKIAILGAGAMGSILAAHLKKAGHDVVLLARGERAKFLQTHGIAITGLSDFTVACPVTTDFTIVSEADILIVTVKTYDMDSALSSVRHMKVSGAVSVQNGVMKNDQLAGVFGKDRTLGGALFASGEVETDGSVRFTLNQCFYVGELAGGVSPRVEGFVHALNASGIKAETSPAIQSVEWSKFISWLGMMPLAVLTRLETGKFLSHPQTALISAKIMKEAAAVAQKIGIALEDRPPFMIRSMMDQPDEEVVKTLCGIGEFMKAATPTHRVSALQDLERGRRLEAGETLGYVAAKAKAEKIDVPTLDTALALISSIDHYITV
jgi:2-dehydropantoate 2-reductase